MNTGNICRNLGGNKWFIEWPFRRVLRQLSKDTFGSENVLLNAKNKIKKKDPKDAHVFTKRCASFVKNKGIFFEKQGHHENGSKIISEIG